MSYTPNQEKLSINSSGALTVDSLITTTSITSGTTISSGSSISSTTTISSGGNLSVTGTIYASGDITAFSDATLKTDVMPIKNALNKIESLTGVTYTKDGKPSIGLIAQNVQSIIPEAVQSNGEHLSVAYGNLVGVLIQAIKELNAEIKNLKEKT